MKKALMFSMMIIIATCICVISKPQSQPQTGAIRGTVVNAITKDPIRNVQITSRAGSLPLQPVDDDSMSILLSSGMVGLAPAGSTGVDAVRALLEQNAVRAGSSNTKSITTDIDGHFLLPSLSSGSYIITATLDGYFAPQTDGRYSTILQKAVVVTANRTDEVTLNLEPGGTISGRVLDAMGMPAVDANVQMFRITYLNGVQKLLVAASKTTDDRGEFRLYRMMPGSYYIAATPRLPNLRNGTTSDDNSRLSQETTVRTFFPSETDFTQASLITIRGGDEIAGTNINLRIAATARIAGQITSLIPASEMTFAVQNGRGAVTSSPTAKLILSPHDTSVPQDPSSIRNVDVSMAPPANGRFDLSGIPPGLYDLYASLPDIKGYGPQAPPGQAGSPVAFGRTVIDVHGEVRNDVTVLVHHGSDIKGSVSVDGRVAPSANNVRISIQPDDSSSTLPVYQQVGRFQPKIDSNGTFIIPAVPEAHYRFRITFGPPLPVQTPLTDLERVLAAAGVPAADTPSSLASNAQSASTLGSAAYVAEILQGGVSIYDTGISAGSGNIDPIQVNIRTDGGMIEGSVQDTRQRLFAGASVVLVPIVEHRQNPSLYRVSKTDGEGKFIMMGIPPGEYKLFAWENVMQGAYQNAKFLQLYEDRGVPLTISPNSSVVAKVGLIQ